MYKNKMKILIVVLLVATLAAFIASGGHHYLSLEAIKEHQRNFSEYYSENPALVLLTFSVIYIASVAASVPGASFLTLAAGALFGFLPALILVSFCSSIGATLAFMAARFVLRDWVSAKFGGRLNTINQGIKKEGAFYLFAIRLTPLIPFWMVNLLMGITSMKPGIFYITSQLGMLPGTVVYVYAGTQLGNISSASDIISPELIGAFILLGIFPILTKKLVNHFRKGKIQ